MRGLATSVEYIVITNVNQRKNDLLYSLSIFLSVCLMLKMDTSVTGGNLLRMKLNFVFVWLVS